MPDPAPSSALVVDTSHSPYARLRPVPLTAVTLTDAFWSPRRRILREVTLPSQYDLLEETGRIDNFRAAASKKDVPFLGRYFNHSDVYKWLEAVAWVLAADEAAALRGTAEVVIAEVADAQGADGYLNTYFTGGRAAGRWANLRDLHELYCAGHLIQAAVAYRRATGSDRLFHVARRLGRPSHSPRPSPPEAPGPAYRSAGHPLLCLGQPRTGSDARLVANPVTLIFIILSA